MKKMLMAAGMAAVMTACGTAGQKAATDAGNPFLAEYSTPFGVPPFDLIKVEHYKEAFLKGMEEQKKEIDAIVNQRSVPDFEFLSGKTFHAPKPWYYQQVLDGTLK